MGRIDTAAASYQPLVVFTPSTVYLCNSPGHTQESHYLFLLKQRVIPLTLYGTVNQIEIISPTLYKKNCSNEERTVKLKCGSIKNYVTLKIQNSKMFTFTSFFRQFPMGEFQFKKKGQLIQSERHLFLSSSLM